MNPIRQYRLFCLLGSIILGVLNGFFDPALAQINADRSLDRPSVITSQDNRTVIRGGTHRGTNLFHSFRNFSVRENNTASFQVPSSVTNIFARVTGSLPSRLNGAIEVLQLDRSRSSANLFLLNPHGILFGPNASLNMGGSFLATTANHITFADGTRFSAQTPQAGSLLTMSVPVGLQFGQHPARIVNRSIAEPLDDMNQPLRDAAGYPIFGLNVSSGQTLALIGGEILMPFGNLRVDGGRIELGSVAGSGLVQLASVANGWAFNYQGIQRFGKVYLQSASVDASGTVGGTIHIRGENVRLLDGAQVLSTNRGTQPGRSIRVTASNLLEISSGSLLQTETDNLGAAGMVNIATQHLIVRDGGVVESRTLGMGQGGDVRVVASDTLTIGGSSSGQLFSLLNTRTLNRGGHAGDVVIQTNQLQVQPGGQISATTFGAGHAGNITIRASTIDLTGTASGLTASNGNNSGGFQIVEASSGIFVGVAPRATGNGGQLSITTEQLNLRDGSLLQASTYGRGDAGDLVIAANDAVNIVGTSESGQRTGIIAASGGLPRVSFSVNPQATGEGGNIRITTDTLTIEDGGLVAVNSLNREAPGAGRLRISARIAALDNGQINAETESSGATIQFPQIGLLLLRRNSDISTNAGNRTRSGTGGDIFINSDYIIATPSEDNDITANAVDNNAGNVTLNASVIGITPQLRETSQSDITATSERGVRGRITISDPVVDPTRGLVELPTTVVDASELISRQCSARRDIAREERSRFIVTGRGGLPRAPEDIRSSDEVLTNWVTLEPSENGRAMEPRRSEIAPSHTMAASHPSLPSTSIVEAQGWVRDEDGRVKLVAPVPDAAPSDIIFSDVGCNNY